jgi:hypothetical protein
MRHTCHFWGPSPLAPWGNGGVPSSCYVCLGVGPIRGVQDAHARLLGEPIGELGVWWASPIAMAKPGVRN